jgi:carbon-monoxide dehydrogenase medium subunit
VIPAGLEYQRVGSAEEAVAVLAERGDDAKLLAGGHSLLPLMKMRLATPSLLVDIGRVSELSYIRDQGDHVAIGALTRHRDLEDSELLRSAVPILAHAAGTVGDPQVRHRGTIGGSLSHGDPASDLPAVALALGATLVAQGPSGVRSIPVGELFQGFFQTALRPDELLTEVRVPKPAAGWSFQKFNRRAMDWAIVGVAAATKAGDSVHGGGAEGGGAGVQDGGVSVALVNMGTTPLRASATEAALAGGASIAEAADRAAEGLDPPGDLNASPEYRCHLARVLVRRALEETMG